MNRRDDGSACCGMGYALDAIEYAKKQIKGLPEAVASRIRVNRAGCLGRCEEGPSLVIYPEGVWYTYQTQEDVDEIIENHVLKGQKVSRLLMD